MSQRSRPAPRRAGWVVLLAVFGALPMLAHGQPILGPCEAARHVVSALVSPAASLGSADVVRFGCEDLHLPAIACTQPTWHTTVELLESARLGLRQGMPDVDLPVLRQVRACGAAPAAARFGIRHRDYVAALVRPTDRWSPYLATRLEAVAHTADDRAAALEAAHIVREALLEAGRLDPAAEVSVSQAPDGTPPASPPTTRAVRITFACRSTAADAGALFERRSPATPTPTVLARGPDVTYRMGWSLNGQPLATGGLVVALQDLTRSYVGWGELGQVLAWPPATPRLDGDPWGVVLPVDRTSDGAAADGADTEADGADTEDAPRLTCRWSGRDDPRTARVLGVDGGQMRFEVDRVRTLSCTAKGEAYQLDRALVIALPGAAWTLDPQPGTRVLGQPAEGVVVGLQEARGGVFEGGGEAAAEQTLAFRARVRRTRDLAAGAGWMTLRAIDRARAGGPATDRIRRLLTRMEAVRRAADAVARTYDGTCSARLAALGEAIAAFDATLALEKSR